MHTQITEKYLDSMAEVLQNFPSAQIRFLWGKVALEQGADSEEIFEILFRELVTGR